MTTGLLCALGAILGLAVGYWLGHRDGRQWVWDYIHGVWAKIEQERSDEARQARPS